MHTKLFGWFTSVFVTVLGLLWGCGNQRPPDGAGAFMLPLVASGAGSRVFVLCQGNLEIQNADNTQSWRLDAAAHAAERSVSQSLPVGDYQLSLSRWQLCEATGSGVAPIAARLESASRLSFHVYPLQTTHVSYSFVVEGVVVSFGGDVVIEIEVREGSLAGDAGTECALGYHRVSTGACMPILFSDDFQDGIIASDWLLWKMTFAETDGRMNATGQPRPGFNYGHSGNGRGAVLATHIGDTTWTDYRIDLDAQALPVGSFNPYGLSSCYRGFGIDFRVESVAESWNEPELNLYGLSFPFRPADCPEVGAAAGSAVLGSGHHSYLTGTGCCNSAPSSSNRDLVNVSAPSLVDGPNHYAVEVVGSRIQCWINGTLAFDYTDDSVPYVNGATPLTYGGIRIDWGWELPGWVDNVVVTDMR